MIIIDKLIKYEDDDLYVCHKPAGVLSQSDKSFSQDMVSALLTYQKKKGVAKPYIAPINRLDRPVEGLILFAKNEKAAAALSKQLTSGLTDKNYMAVVEFRDDKAALMEALCRSSEETILTNYLLKDSKTNMSRVVNAGDEKVLKDAKEAKLSYLVRKTDGKRALLLVKLYTGRHHQIRVQLREAGIPIVGDTKYNPEGAKTPDGNIALCSVKLEFRQPTTGKKLEINTMPVGRAFNGMLE